MKLGPKSCPQDCSPEVWRLYCAAANGDLDTVKQIIRDSPDSMHQFIWYESPLHFAVRENQIDVVRELLQARINPAYSNFNYSSWQTLLPIAKQRGFKELHAILVAEMKQRFNYDSNYETLWKTIVSGDVEGVKKLTEANTDLLNIGDEHGNRAIHWAVLARRIPILQCLLDAGSDINAKRADLQSPLHLALNGDYWFGKNNQCDPETSARDVAVFLRDKGAKYDFAAAVAFNDMGYVKLALAKNQELPKRLDDSRRSPLYIAAKRGHIDMVRLLLDHGANPNLPEHCARDGRALFEASARNDIEMMKLLIKHGANADAYVDSSGNCLSIAQQGGERETEAVELLKKHGAQAGEWEIDSKEQVLAALNDMSFVPNRDMWSSILGRIIGLDETSLVDKYVARFGNDDIRDLNAANGWRIPKSKRMLAKLLQHGADINARDWYGRTFLHHASCFENPDVAEFLIEAGIDINAIDHQSGTTALGLAAWSERMPIVDLLLNAGANPQLPTDAQWARPLTFAIEQGHDDIVERLKSET